MFWWHGDGTRRPLRDGGALWQQVFELAARSGSWTGERYAFLEFVRDDDPEAFLRDAAQLRGWLTAGAAPPSSVGDG